VEQNFH